MILTSYFRAIYRFGGWQGRQLNIILIMIRKLLYNAGGRRYNDLLFER